MRDDSLLQVPPVRGADLKDPPERPSSAGRTLADLAREEVRRRGLLDAAEELRRRSNPSGE